MPLRMLEAGDKVALISTRHGRSYLVLLALETALFATLLVRLATVTTSSLEIVIPFLACVAVMVWTASHIASDVRLEVDRASRRASLVRIDPLTGFRARTDFPVDAVERMSLRPLPSALRTRRRPPDYVVTIELRGGDHHVVSDGAPLLLLRDRLDRFSSASGLSTRIERA